MLPMVEAGTATASRPARPALVYVEAAWAFLRALWAVFDMAQEIRQ